jgi:hypothetical protein
MRSLLPFVIHIWSKVNNEKANNNDFSKPILSASAPVKVGKNYKPAEKLPETQAASISSKPKIRDK